MTSPPRLTFFLDVDNTLLNNDAAKAEMNRRLVDLLEAEGAGEFWRIYEAIREERSVVDIPTTVARFCASRGDRDPRFVLAELFMRFPFQDFVYPGAYAALTHLRTLGTTAILSDGDPVFQALKVFRSGLAAALDGHVVIYPHKEAHLAEITAAFPADRYVFIDDKPSILERVSALMTAPCSTVFIRQGKYAAAPLPSGWQGATHTIDSLSELLTINDWGVAE